MEQFEAQMGLWDAVIALHAEVHVAMSVDAFVAAVFRVVPAEYGLLDVEVVAGGIDLHESGQTVVVPLPGAVSSASVVLHIDPAVGGTHHWERFGRTVASLAGLLRVRHGDAGSADDAFDAWLHARNDELEHELERLRALARFLMETAQRQLDG